MPDIVWGPDEPIKPPPPLDIDHIISVLNDHHVDFVVIGGIAAIVHGNPRTTFDVDVIAALEAENLRRLAAALVALNARIWGIDRDHTGMDPTDPDDLALGGNWVLVTDAGRLDIMSAAEGAAPYDQLRERAITLRDRPFKVVGLNDLIAMKQASNRDKDRADISALCRIHAIESPAPQGQPSPDGSTCGAWMPIVRAACGRRPGHAGRHGRR